jgi:hypothetical protein
MVDIGLVIGGEVLIPVWFYIFSCLAYFASFAISLIVSYFAFRIYRTSSLKKFLYLGIAFLVLGISFLALTLSSIYTYFYVPYFRETLNIPLSFFNNSAFDFYYILSLVSYLLLFITYFPKEAKKKLYVLYVPLWFISSADFHLASLFLLAFVISRAAYNFYKYRSLNTLLVMSAFLLMASFHVFTFLLPFDLTLYLLSHALLAAGFISLLAMLIRVNRGG